MTKLKQPIEREMRDGVSIQYLVWMLFDPGVGGLSANI